MPSFQQKPWYMQRDKKVRLMNSWGKVVTDARPLKSPCVTLTRQRLYINYLNMFKTLKEAISREPKYQNDVWANRKDDYMRQKLSKKKNSLKGLNSRYKWAEKTVNLKTGQLRLVCRIERKKYTKINQNFRDLWDPHQVYKYDHSISPMRRENEMSKKNI